MESAYGYDGSGIAKGSRVEFSPACDLWIRGARYGTVERVYLARRRGNLRGRYCVERAIVRVDATGRAVRLPLSLLSAV